MKDLRFDLLFVGAWVLGLAILLVGLLLTWINRLPGTYIGDFMNGPKGQHSPRVLHQYTDAMRLVQPEKRSLIYIILLTGTSICAGSVIVLLMLALLVPGAYK